MTFLEVLMLIGERGEKMTVDKTSLIQTDKFLYTREHDNSWIQKELPIYTIEVDKFPPLESILPQTKKKK
jgi:hypothetical protein